MDNGRLFGDCEEVKLRKLGQCWGKLASDIKDDGNLVSSFVINHFNQPPKATFLEERHSVWGNNEVDSQSWSLLSWYICLLYFTPVAVSVFCFPL